MAEFSGGDLPKGSFRPFGDNEVILRSTIQDPIKYRGDGPGDGGGAILSASVDGVEIGFIAIRPDSRYRGTGQRVGYLDVFLMRPRLPNDPPGMTDDQRMVRVFELTWEDAIGGLPTPPGQPPGPLPGDAFAQAVRAIYRDILKRGAFPYASDEEVNAHRGNPGGIEAVRRMCEQLGPGH